MDIYICYYPLISKWVKSTIASALQINIDIAFHISFDTMEISFVSYTLLPRNLRRRPRRPIAAVNRRKEKVDKTKETKEKQ